MARTKLTHALVCTLLVSCGTKPLLTDAGAPDAGAPDAGAPDAGAPDAGAPDAGAPDAGTPDAGTCGPGNCAGCCNGTECEPLTNATGYCGAGGESCTLCQSGTLCQNGVCTCQPGACTGCCDDNNVCVTGTYHRTCGPRRQRLQRVSDGYDV